MARSTSPATAWRLPRATWTAAPSGTLISPRARASRRRVQAAIAGSGVAALLELIQESRSVDIWAVCASAVAEIPPGTARRRSATAQLWSVFMGVVFFQAGFRCAKPIWWTPLGQAWASPLGPAICGRGGDIAVFKREEVMRTKTAALAIFAACTFIGAAGAQDLGPQVKKLAAGVYVHTRRGFESNSGIILTQDGFHAIDTGPN